MSDDGGVPDWLGGVSPGESPAERLERERGEAVAAARAADVERRSATELRADEDRMRARIADRVRADAAEVAALLVERGVPTTHVVKRRKTPVEPGPSSRRWWQRSPAPPDLSPNETFKCWLVSHSREYKRGGSGPDGGSNMTMHYWYNHSGVALLPDGSLLTYGYSGPLTQGEPSTEMASEVTATGEATVDVFANGGAERHAEQRFATLGELYELAAAVPERYRGLVLTAGLAGLRIGELSALRRKDIDLVNGRIHVRRKRMRLASGEVIEGDPKSEAGRRTVALPDTLVPELEWHLRKFTDNRATAYVFTSQQKSALDRSTFRKRVWLPATKKVGLTGLRFHDLRHTAGTLAARTGATTKELMARLGHASPRAAMIYQHATADRDEHVAAGLAAMTREAGLAEVVPIKARDAR